MLFPAWETLPHERLSPRSDTVGKRLAVLRRLVHPGEPGMPESPIRVVVAPVRAILQPQVRGLADVEPVSLQVGDEVDLEDVVRRLADAAYHRVDLVERRGEFAVRGGIIDVFPSTEEHPLRLDFFGDEIEEIRSFAVADQRSLQPAASGLWAPPCRELLLTEEGLVLLDLDEMATGDPALDLAEIAVDVGLRRLPRATSAPFLDALGQAYVAAGGTPPRPAVLRGYAAAELLNRCYRRLRRPVPGWEQELERDLADAHVVLTGAALTAPRTGSRSPRSTTRTMTGART